MALTRRSMVTTSLALAGAAELFALPADASAQSLYYDGVAALNKLLGQSSKARLFNKNCKAVLVFPKILKAGFMIGAQTGDGVLLEHGQPTAYYNISAGSFGLQAGGQVFSYALFFMNNSALSYLHQSEGWAIGSGPSVVVIDKGKAMSTTTTTITQDVYAFPFGQAGLMAGLGLEGSKITHIHPK